MGDVGVDGPVRRYRRTGYPKIPAMLLNRLASS
ncbi:hypothetical protein HDA45_003571 [Amycolatopsis umgeniensis]|uniref:Uncharacterized protein n=1 Tax=Amycolatopsis umgeniensis TaxID=336628 RepID=A0A841B4Q6_9PSEU|nr:hypothetical protein [Amycolatopsis umgeniensis]